MSVIRLKRLINEEPSEALVVHYKRQKLDDSSPSEPSKCQTEGKIFKFVGTIDHKNDDSFKEIAKIISSQRKDPKSQSPIGVQKAKRKVKETSKKNRYKLINSFRGISAETSEDYVDSISETSELNVSERFNLLDAESDEIITTENVPEIEGSSITCNGVPMQQFVYDVYYVDGGLTEKDIWQQPLSIEDFPYLEEVVGSESRDDDKDFFDDEDDSNSESNWRNDYPDEESEEENYEDNDFDVCIKKMASCLIDHNYDRSRTPSDASDECVSVDETDVKQFGRAYASYKAKILSEDSE